MATQPPRITITEWNGGISRHQKKGPPNSARFIKNLNIYENANYVTLMPAANKVSGTTAIGLVKVFADGSPFNSYRYAYDDIGTIYQIDPSNETWTVIKNETSASGQGLCVFDNYLYYSRNRTLGRYGKLSGTPTFSSNFLSDGTTDLDQSTTNSGSTYTLPSSISETSTNYKTFVPTSDPIQSISVYVTTKGTGDWTLTVHDANNLTVCSATIVNASLTNATLTSFDFGDSQGRVTTGNTYHIHLTSSDGTGTTQTSSLNDLSTLYYKEYFGTLVYDANFHPIVDMLNGIAVGNERYIAFWDQATYSPNKLTFGPGFKVRALTKINEYLVAACWTGSITTGERARLYFWDGIEDTFNFFKDLPRGSIHGVTNYREQAVSFLGTRAVMHFGYEPFISVQELPKLSRGSYIDINPGGISVWQNKLVIGAAIITNDGTTFEQGVYMFGNERDDDPQALTMAFQDSTGTTVSTNHAIGAVGAFGQDLYFSWKNGSTYGVDKVITTNSATANTGSWESLIFDNGKPSKEKQSQRLVITSESLPAGCTLTPKYKVDRGSWVNSQNPATQGATQAYIEFTNRFKEIEFGFDVTSTLGNYPIIVSLTFFFDPCETEKDFSA